MLCSWSVFVCRACVVGEYVSAVYMMNPLVSYLVLCSLFSFCNFLILVFYYVFFFKKKTAYEWRISDWSSDVCSSDLEPELVATVARLNNVLRRFGGSWALFFEAERHEAPGYPSSDFPGPASWLVDRERQAAFEQAPSPFDDVVKAVRREHFESAYYLTLLYLPPPDQVSRAERALLEVPPEERGLDYRDYLKAFVAETERAFDLLAGIMPECARSEEHTSELQSLMRISYAVFCLKTKKHKK